MALGIMAHHNLAMTMSADFVFGFSSFQWLDRQYWFPGCWIVFRFLFSLFEHVRFERTNSVKTRIYLNNPYEWRRCYQLMYFIKSEISVSLVCQRLWRPLSEHVTPLTWPKPRIRNERVKSGFYFRSDMIFGWKRRQWWRFREMLRESA